MGQVVIVKCFFCNFKAGIHQMIPVVKGVRDWEESTIIGGHVCSSIECMEKIQLPFFAERNF